MDEQLNTTSNGGTSQPKPVGGAPVLPGTPTTDTDLSALDATNTISTDIVETVQPTALQPAITQASTEDVPAEMARDVSNSFGDTTSSTVAQTVAPAASSQQSTSPQMAAPSVMQPLPANKKRPKKALLLILAAAVLLLGGGSAAAYIALVRTTPEQAWERALERTRAGFEKVSEQTAFLNEGTMAQGAFDASGEIEADGSFTSKSKGNNGTASLDVGIAGVRLEAELRTIEAANSTLPDLYFKVKGLNGLSDILSNLGLGLGEVTVPENLNDAWFMVDHTLFEQGQGQQVSIADLTSLSKEAQKIIADHLFATDPNKAVFSVKEQLGREEFEGLDTYKYKVAINQDNLTKMITALEEAIKNSKLGDVSAGGVEADQLLDTSRIDREIEQFNNEEVVVDIWVEARGRYVRNIRYTDTNADRTMTVDFGLPLETADKDTLPFVATIQEQKEGKNEQIAELKAVFNTSSRRLDLLATINQGAGMPTGFKATMSISPNTEDVKPDTPADTLNLLDFLGGLLGASDVSGSELAQEPTSDTADTERKADIDALHQKLEAYYVQAGYYPCMVTPTILGDSSSSDIFTDPDGGVLISVDAVENAAAANANQNPDETQQYKYIPYGQDGVGCLGYVLRAYQAADITAPYYKNSLN